MQGPRAACTTTRAPSRSVHRTRPELFQQHGDAAWVLKDQARQILSEWPIEDTMFSCEYGLSCHCFIYYSFNRPISIAAVTTIDFWGVFQSDDSGCPG